MTEYVAELKDWGNSYGFRIPKKIAASAGWTKGQKIGIPLRKPKPKSGFGIFKGKYVPFVREYEDRF